MRVWVSQTHQVLIKSKLIVNKSKKGTNLLVEYPLPLIEKPIRLQTTESKPRVWPCKNTLERPTGKRACIKIIVIGMDDFTDENELV